MVSTILNHLHKMTLWRLSWVEQPYTCPIIVYITCIRRCDVSQYNCFRSIINVTSDNLHRVFMFDQITIFLPRMQPYISQIVNFQHTTANTDDFAMTQEETLNQTADAPAHLVQVEEEFKTCVLLYSLANWSNESFSIVCLHQRWKKKLKRIRIAGSLDRTPC